MDICSQRVISKVFVYCKELDKLKNKTEVEKKKKSSQSKSEKTPKDVEQVDTQDFSYYELKEEMNKKIKGITNM